MKIIEEQHVKKFWAFLEISKPINRWAEQGVTWLNRKERLHINVKHELGAGNQDPDRKNLLYSVHSYYVLLHFCYCVGRSAIFLTGLMSTSAMSHRTDTLLTLQVVCGPCRLHWHWQLRITLFEITFQSHTTLRKEIISWGSYESVS